MCVTHEETFPPPVSDKIACLPFARRYVAKGANELLMLFVTHAEWVPLLSESKYWCTSKIRLALVPSRFLIVMRAAAEPFET